MKKRCRVGQEAPKGCRRLFCKMPDPGPALGKDIVDWRRPTGLRGGGRPFGWKCGKRVPVGQKCRRPPVVSVDGLGRAAGMGRRLATLRSCHLAVVPPGSPAPAGRRQQP